MKTSGRFQLAYDIHPAFSFSQKPFQVDSSKILAFDKNCKEFAVSVASPQKSKVNARLGLQAQVCEIFQDMMLQANDEYESCFLAELQLKSLELLNSQIGTYFATNRGISTSEEDLLARSLDQEKHFFGTLNAQAITDINWLISETINQFRGNAEAGLLKRDDLSIGCGPVVASVVKILNKAFKRQGILDAVSSYMGRSYRVGGCAIELSVAQATWWRSTLVQTAPPKTLYAHLDESIEFPKAIVYLSTVATETGPTSCYPGVYDRLQLNSLQEIIGRIINTVGSKSSSILHKYYNMQYHQAMSSKTFRRHFMRLPPELRFNSHFGWDVLPGSREEDELVAGERVMLGGPGTYIIFDGARLLHRGGLLASGERIALQIIFTPVPRFFQRAQSFTRRVLSKLRRLHK
jgi:hypothetical protein